MMETTRRSDSLVSGLTFDLPVTGKIVVGATKQLYETDSWWDYCKKAILLFNTDYFFVK